MPSFNDKQFSDRYKQSLGGKLKKFGSKSSSRGYVVLSEDENKNQEQIKAFSHDSEIEVKNPVIQKSPTFPFNFNINDAEPQLAIDPKRITEATTKHGQDALNNKQASKPIIKLSQKVLSILEYKKLFKKSPKWLGVLMILAAILLQFELWTGGGLFRVFATDPVLDIAASNMVTGTPPFNVDDTAGNDSSQDNTIVRTGDLVTYNINYSVNNAAAQNPRLPLR